MELLAWELRWPNAVTCELQSFGFSRLQFWWRKIYKYCAFTTLLAAHICTFSRVVKGNHHSRHIIYVIRQGLQLAVLLGRGHVYSNEHNHLCQRPWLPYGMLAMLATCGEGAAGPCRLDVNSWANASGPVLLDLFTFEQLNDHCT